LSQSTKRQHKALISTAEYASIFPLTDFQWKEYFPPVCCQYCSSDYTEPQQWSHTDKAL